jgi:hypothetical protein
MHAIPGRPLARTASAIVPTIALVLAALSDLSLHPQQAQQQPETQKVEARDRADPPRRCGRQRGAVSRDCGSRVGRRDHAGALDVVDAGGKYDDKSQLQATTLGRACLQSEASARTSDGNPITSALPATAKGCDEKEGRK